MVGVPRSSGCQLCVQRRVKCDGVRPACGNCTKYGAECPGYARELKFVTGKHVVRSRRRKDTDSAGSTGHDGLPIPSTVSTGTSSASGSGSSPPSSLEQGDYGSGWPVISTSDPGTRLQPDPRVVGWRPVMVEEPTASRGQFISALTDNIKRVEGEDEIAIFDTWLKRVPDHLGSKVTIDSAMCCLVTHLLGKIKSDQGLVVASRQLYGRSLGALQRALNHPVEWRSDETLAAAMILCAFELFSGTSDPASWMRHCQGIARLIQQRGPEAHSDGLSATLLLSFRSIIIMNDMFDAGDKGCFLATRRWKAVARDNGRNLFNPRAVPDSWIANLDDYLELLAELPQVVTWVYALREARRAALPVDAERAAELVRRCTRLHARYLVWFGRFETLTMAPYEVPSRDPASLYPTVLWYEKKWGGALYVGYWASMLIVQETLNQCRADDGFAAANRLFVSNILRSIESLSQGIMGPFRLGYAIRVAFEFADVPTQIWLKMWLDRFEKTYAATTREMYPETQENEYGYS